VDLPTVPAWHQALAYALTGHRYPELGRQQQPDVAAVAAFLRDRRPPGSTAFGPPHRVPPELAEGIGPAQFWAAVTELRRHLDREARPPVPVIADRALSADELRLLREVPPHHGS
jgi:hypothetical protein